MLSSQLRKDILVEVRGVEPDIVKNVEPLEYHKWYLDNSQFQWARKFLQPAKHILRRAEFAASEIHALYSAKYFFAVHFRQGDFQQACPSWEGAIDNLRCMISADEAFHAIHTRFKVPEQSVLFILPPHPLESLGQLCEVYKCTHRELLPHFKHATEDLTETEVAQSQFALAMQSARAFGNIYSSYSVELIANMRLAGKPADIMNIDTCMADSQYSRRGTYAH